MTPDTLIRQPTGYDDLLGGIKAIAENLRGLQELGVNQYTPVVEQILASNSGDAHHIQHTLDHLLDFACQPGRLVLHKTLCRYYYTFKPAATVAYLNDYREMWDNEETEAPQ